MLIINNVIIINNTNNQIYIFFRAIKSRIDKKKSSKEQAKEKDIKTIEELEQFKTNHPTNI